MEELVGKLRKMALELEAAQQNVFVLQTGEDLEQLLEKCQTLEDVLELARRWNDCLLDPARDGDRDLRSNHDGFFGNENAEVYGPDRLLEDLGWEEDEPNDAINREIITHYHLPPPEEQDEEEEHDSFDDPVPTAEELLGEFLEEQGIAGKWQTWGECFCELGYEHPAVFDEFFFDSPYDILDIQLELGGPPDEEPLELTSEEYLYEQVDYCQRFYLGELSPDELLTLATAVLEFCDAQAADYAEAADQTDSSEEAEDELRETRYMVAHELDHLVENTPVRTPALEELRSAVFKADLDDTATIQTYLELWERIDELYADEEDKIYDKEGKVVGSQQENRKRARIEFDLVEQPLEEIRFEQGQTDLLLDEPSTKRLIQEIAQDFELDLHFTEDAFAAIQTAAEDYLVKVFGNANRIALSAELTHISPKHLQLARRIDSGDTSHQI